MVELFVERCESRFNVREVHHPTQGRVWFTTNVDFDTEGMAMQARALVPLGHVRQAVGGFDLENFEDMHAGMLPAPP